MNWQNFIITDEQILAGKPVVKDTRLSVEHILKLYASGWTENQILENYPSLTKESLMAVFTYVNEILKDGMIFKNSKAV